MRVVLSGAVRNGIWDHFITPIERMPKDMVMSPKELTEASLASLDLGEVSTIPSPPDYGDWEQVELASRRAPNLSG